MPANGSTAAPHGEPGTEARKTVTILFADIVASTELGERLDAEALRHVVSRYFTEMAAVLERHGGTVEKFIGDEVMAVFGVPVVHEDDALRAVRAGAAMRQRLAELNEELAGTWGARLESRIAINTGLVVAGDASVGHGFVTGEPVNLAKRIQQAASPGEILIGAATYALVRHAVETSELEPFNVKGKRDKVVAHRLDRVDLASETFLRRFDAPLVGRSTELRALRYAHARALETRRPQLVTVLGAAGIGKSRLVRELLDEVGAEARVLVGRCLPYGEGVTFWPVRDILPGELLGGTRDEIFWRVRTHLQELAGEQPLVICFEDVHWGEPTFLDLVQYLAGWLRDAPVTLLCLARPELLEHRPDWAVTGTDTLSIRLGRLNDDDAVALLDHLQAESGLRAAIARAAEGNPLFVEQMVAMAAEEGRVVTVPPSIQALLAARLDRLEPREKAVVERAAVIGREFPLRAVIDLAPPDLQPLVSAHLFSLVRKELVRPHAEGDGDRFRFRHALIRDAAYDGMPKALRAELHERHAAWLEDSRSSDVLVGYHLEQAVLMRRQLGFRDDTTESLASRAGVLLTGAGGRALRRGDMPAAVGLLTRASSLFELDERAQLQLAPDLGAALRDMGEPAKADAVLERAIARARALGDRRIEARAEIARSIIRMQREPEGALTDVARVAQGAIEVFTETGDENGLAQAWGHLSRVHLISSRWGQAAEALEQALIHARRAGDRREEAIVLGQLALAFYWGPTPVPIAIDRCERMLAETEHHPAVDARVTVAIAGLEAMRGNFDRARDLYWHSRQILVDLGLRPWLAAHTLALASVETLAGNPAAAVDELREGVETLEELGLRSSFSTLASTYARACFELGNLSQAEELVESARKAAVRDDVASEVLWRTTAARLLEAGGELEDAERYAREAVLLAEQTDALNLHADSLVDLAAILTTRGDEAGRAVALSEAVRLYGLKGNEVSAQRAAGLRSKAIVDT